MKDEELEHLIDRSLKQLSRPTAPATLLPRILKAVRAQQIRPRYVRGWFDWPRLAQVVSGVVLLAVVVGLVRVAPIVGTVAVGEYPGFGSGILAVARGLLRSLDALLRAGDSVWDTVIAPAVCVLGIAAAIVGASCAGLGVALRRVALGGTLQP